jgi:hypothetical protein
MSSFISCEQGVAIIEDYDERSLYPILLKCYHHLYLVIGFESEFVDSTVNVDYSLDIFAIAIGTNELAKEIVKRKLLICKPY